MNLAQTLSTLEQSFEAQNAVTLECGDKVFAPIGDGGFVVAYVYSFNSETVTFQTTRGFQWLMTLTEANENTSLIEKFNREIMQLMKEAA
jgi:hypothetical protein